MNNYTEDAPLYRALVRHAGEARASFHTPGHKGHCPFLPLDPRLDLTELPDTDSLFEADGCIRQAEERAARLFGAAYTAISSGGCTNAMQGMLAAFAPPGSKVIFGRNVHRAAVNTAVLMDYDPVWVMHRRGGGPYGNWLPGRIHAEDVARAIEENPDAAAVYITSPDYYGCLSDIRAIAEVCRARRKPLLVDNAHGTHLIAFGLHPITLGAAASACSAHKTLPVITGGAWLNVADHEAASRVKGSMALFGSTSPNYLTMASLDLARAWMERDGAQAFRALAENVRELREAAAARGFGLPDGECDPVRLTLFTRPLGFTGGEAAGHFRLMGLEPEHSDSAAVIFILTPFNTPEEITALRDAVRTFPVRFSLPEVAAFPGAEPFFPDSLPERVLSPREAFASPRELIPVENAAGRIAAEVASVCPPGTPAVIPGEKISDNCVKILLNTGIHKINVIL